MLTDQATSSSKQPPTPIKIHLIAVSLAFLSTIPVHGGSATPPIPVKGYRLVWSDEFDGTHLDMAKWDYRTDSKMWSTQKLENVSVSDGLLRIGLRKEEANGMHYTGGGVISRKSFRYGYY